MTTFRKICHWLHRELGYLAVGLTLVYAISGIAVNHVQDWDPSYRRSREVSWIETPGRGTTDELAARVLPQLSLTEPVKDVWRAAPDHLQVFVEGATWDVNLDTGEVVRESFAKRPFFYEINYLHYNTGKAPWTGIADVFAGVLIILAITGIFLVRGRKGLGFVLPLVYIVLAAYR
jgi:hypothetical protein